MQAQDEIVQDYKKFLAEYRRMKSVHGEKAGHAWHRDNVKLMVEKWGQLKWEEAREYYFAHPGQC